MKMKKVNREHIDPRLYESIYSCLQAVILLVSTLPLSEFSERLIRDSTYGIQYLQCFFDYDGPLDGSFFRKKLEEYVTASDI